MLHSGPRFSLLLAFATALVAQSAPVATTPQRPPQLDAIRAAELQAHAAWLASPERAGRLTGSPGQEAAARYIAAHFENLGLEPLGDVVDGTATFMQHYGIERTSVAAATELQFGELRLADGFAILGGRPLDLDLRGSLRFVGLGRTRGAAADLPADADLDGAVAVVALKMPRGRLPGSMSVEQKFGVAFPVFGQLGRTAKALAQRGAGAVVFLVVDDPIGLADVLNYLALAPGKDSIAARFPGADPGMGAMSGMLGGGEGPPALVLSVPASTALAEQLDLDRTALDGYVAGDGELPSTRGDLEARIRLVVVRDTEATACNVVAVRRGSDPQLAGEAVVYSAHMDHVGTRLDGAVFHGADDNASGSAGLLAIAAAFASGPAPRRSVIFLSVSGEELGLWGSQFFADHPTWPIESIVANINTDMIGRSGPESGPFEVTVTPSYRHRAYSTLVRDSHSFAAALGMSFSSGDKYYMRSDHYNFARKGIPVVFFCNGEHEDYHQVTDTADKLDPDKMERIARLAFWTGWAAANSDERPQALGRQEEW